MKSATMMEIYAMPVEMRGRHAQVTPKAMLWKCPACSAEQSGSLELGCQSCGSGAPGSHVGVPPPPRRVVDPEPIAPATPTDTVDQAFLVWRKQAHHHQAVLDSDGWQLVHEAFKAGFHAGIGQVSQQQIPLSGTAESRTIIAALRLFAENILPTAAEEIQSGEFLSLEATEALIQRLERTNG